MTSPTLPIYPDIVTRNPIGYSDIYSHDSLNIAAKRQKAIAYNNKGALIQAPAWATATAYIANVSVVRHSNGQLMLCTTSGTSDATTEPTFSSTAAITEESGTATWAWFGRPSRLNSDGYEIPVITCDSTVPSGASIVKVVDATTPGAAVNGTITGGSSYTDGTYTDVTLTGGTGTGALAKSIVVSGNVVTAVTLEKDGSGDGYINGDTLSAAAANIGGTGSGFVYTLNRIMCEKLNIVSMPATRKVNMIAGVYAIPITFNPGGSGGLSSQGTIMEFVTDDPNPGISFHLPSTTSFNKVWVDGYLIEESPTALVSASNSYYKISWSGVRKERKYRVLTSQPIDGVAILSSSSLRPVEPGVKGVYIGDSYHNTPSVGDYLAHDIFFRNGIDAPRDLGIGGTGYKLGKSAFDYNVSATNYNGVTTLLLNDNTDYSEAASVVIAHGLNDLAETIADTTTNALALWSTARGQFPRAVIHIFGVWPENSGPDSTHNNLDNALYSKFLEWNDTRAFYHSTCQDESGSWTSGTGKWGSTTGTGNADFYINSDGTHPTYPGREYLVSRMAEIINNDLLAFGL